jgi:hypothetical protein
MVKAVVQIVRLVIIQTMTIHRVLLVQRGNTVIKCFKHLIFPAKHARWVPIPPPKGYPVLMGATIVPQANIPRKKATRNHRNAKPASSDSFKICLETPRVANAPVDGETS